MRGYIKNFFNKRKAQVSIIIPTYNAEKTLKKCVESVTNQSIGFEKIELIIVDDCSTDSTQEIIKQYKEKYPWIKTKFLKTNSGGAGKPRNIGLELVTTKYLMFLDSDDWLEATGVEQLLNKAKCNNLDFVVGRTVMIRGDKRNIHAEFMSYKEVAKTKPIKFPYLFYHLGPPAKLIKSDIILKNDLKFPLLKFAEDKYFFSMVIGLSKSVGMTKEVIYYVNRSLENKKSLTATVSLIDKRRADLYTYKKLMSANLQKEIKEILAKRFLEYDFIKSCDSKVFEDIEDKGEYLNLIRQAFLVEEKRKKQNIESFDSDLYKMAANLLLDKSNQIFIDYMYWVRRPKQVELKNNTAYYKLPEEFLFSEKLKLEVNFTARAIKSQTDEDKIIQKFITKGKLADTVSSVILREREDPLNEYKIKVVKLKKNEYYFQINRATLEKAKTGYYSLFVRYGEYRLANIKNDVEMFSFDRTYKLYTSKYDNLTFSIKENEDV